MGVIVAVGLMVGVALGVAGVSDGNGVWVSVGRLVGCVVDVEGNNQISDCRDAAAPKPGASGYDHHDEETTHDCV